MNWKTQIIPEYVVFYNVCGILLGRCLTCEELVGLLTGDDGVGLVQKYNIRVHRLCVRALRARDAKNVLLAYKNRP